MHCGCGSCLRIQMYQIKQCPDLLWRKKAVSFKRDLKVTGRDSYCAVRHQITPVRFRTPDLCPWMGLLVALPQPVNRDVGIDLRGGQAAVAKDFLDCAQVGSAIQQMRGR